jgi:GWxTD domain-containing protein
MRLIPFISILLLISILWSQPGYRGPSQGRANYGMQKPFNVRPFPVLISENEYRVYLFVELMHDILQFTFDKNTYQAKFETELIFTEEKTKATFSQIWQSQFSLADYGETNSRQKFFLTYDSLTLPPGNYDVSFRYQDLQGKQNIPFEFKFQLPSMKKITIASPLFVNLDRPLETMIPNLEYRPIASFSQISFNENIGLFVAAHAENTRQLDLSVYLQDIEMKTTFFRFDTLLSSGTTLFTGTIKPPILKLEEGNYQVKLTINTEIDSISIQTPLEIRWLNKPRSLRTLDYALQPLQIILSKNEYDQLSSGGKQEKADKFMNFWKEKDPSPETAFNELLYEFYSRVDSVDREFGSKNRRYGWRTDPGRIILMYGEPDLIEDQSLNPVKPYLSWSYILPDTTLTFIFQAIDGRKRYRLIQEQENIN